MLSLRKPLLILSLLAASAPAAAGTAGVCSAATGATTIPLVELYTSEGCDSCPPADRWLRKTFPPATSPAQSSVLAFHVDYWDSLGWPDRFADSAYTRRQQDMVRAAGGRTAYTPQLLVQGRDRGLWRSGGVEDALRTAERIPSRVAIDLAASTQPDAVQVDVAARATGAKPADLVTYVALTESSLSSSVTAGENKGAKLVHDHVVRALAAGPAFDSTGASKGAVRFALPLERGTNATVVVFVQHRATGEIVQSLSLPLCKT